MEKIQQALEKARQQRQDAEKNIAVRKERAADTQSIEYNKTRSFTGHVETMRERRILSAMEHNEYHDAFKILSTQVTQRMEENHWNSIGVTSVRDNEGKTTTAINLGISIAKEIEYTVLLVDTNLRNPELHKYFGIPDDRGLSDFLQSDIELSEILIKPENVDHLIILPGGTPTMRSTELLGSPKMCALVEDLKTRYPNRISIFDMPPLLKTADTLSFLPCVDCALVVVEDDATKEEELKHAVDLLSVTNVIGTVLNKARYK